MHIALSSEACEGDAHPHAVTHQSTDHPDRSQLECDARNLPYQTLRAQQRALSLTALPQRARCALAALAQTVDCRKPLASIFARRGYLSNRAGLSARTWYRAEQDLVDAGLITVADQGRKSRGGLFGGAYIYLTTEAATMLGLLGAEKTQAARGDAREKLEPQGGSRTVDESASDAARTTQPDSFIQPSANMADGFTYKNYLSPTSLQKRQQDRVPADVQPLLSLGFHENFIFKLMKLARVQHGKRLGDVVQACLEPLRKARSPVSYLLKLLSSPTDFAWVARQRQAEAVARDEHEQAANAEQTGRRQLAGQIFFSASGATRYEVDGDGCALTVHEAAKNVSRIALSGWLGGFTDAVSCGVIVPASPALAARFATWTAASTSVPPIVPGRGAMTQSIEACRSHLRTALGGQRALRAVAV
jgi:hypothetical protein